jgi:hypothetical protein
MNIEYSLYDMFMNSIFSLNIFMISIIIEY